MRKWTVFSILFLGPCGAAQELGLQEGLSNQIAALNREAAQSQNPAEASALLTARASLMAELIAVDPAGALTMTLPGDVAAQLRRLAPNAPIESQGAWQGTAEERVEDDFAHHRSRTHWFIHTSEGKFELFFAGQHPKLPGSTIAVRGIKSLNRIAVASLTVAAANAPPQPCKTTGAQNIAVLMLTTPGNPAFPAGFTSSYFQQEFFGSGSGSLGTDSLNRFWQETSYGLTSATGQVFGPFALSQSYTCDQSSEMAAEAIAKADPLADFTQFNRIAMVFPVQSCSFGGLGDIGCEAITSPSKGSLPASLSWLPIFSYVGTTLELPVVAHELGHNLGLNHASSDDYGSVPLGALDNPGVTAEYGDPFSVMGAAGSSNNNQPIGGQYSAEHKALVLHWLTDGGYQEVESSGTFDLVPFESSSGPRALRILRDAVSGAWLWVEYRQPIGDVDSSFSLWQPLNITDVYNGALIHYEDPALDPLHTYLLDFNPSSVPNNFLNSTLTAGRAWSDPYSLLTLAVNSADAGGLSMTVRYDQPCATLQASQTVFDPLGGTGIITVGAGANCSWNASAAANWITLTGATSGNGNGAVAFSIAPNGAALQRNSTVTVQRQGVAIVQSGTGLSVLSVTPHLGAGNAGQFVFQLRDGAGYRDISYADLYFSDIGANYNSGGVPECVAAALGAGYLYLQNDAGDQWLAPLNLSIGGQSVSNSQCTIYSTGSSITGSGDLLTITLNVSFSLSFAGTHRITGEAFNGSGGTNAIALGSWKVVRAPSVKPLKSGSDFDGNGVPDLVWLNDATRQVTVNYFGGAGGATYLGWNYLNQGGVPGWHVVAVADFNGDGVPDLVWQNDTTAQVTVNYYGGAGGAAYQGWAWLDAHGEPGWQVVGAADFNGDGVPDLVWMNSVTRQVTVNYFGGAGGATYLGWDYLNQGGVPGWHVVAVADFNGDGVPDLVWQNDSTAQVTVNYYGGAGGAGYQGWAWLDVKGEPGWQVAGAADFNGDGAPDLIWMNSATRQVTVNYFGGAGGAAYLGWNYLNQGGASGWTVVNR